MTVEAVIFDWGGTLTPWHQVDPNGAWQSFAGVLADPADEALVVALCAAEQDAWDRSRDDHSGATLDAIMRAAGVDCGHERHAAAVAAYHDWWVPHTFIDPDAIGLLSALRADGLRIGVLSNTVWSRGVHEEVFRRDGVLDLIDGAVYSSEIRYAKPHPAAFRAAMDAVGITAPDAVYVGDRLFEDVYGAQQAGMRAILVPHSTIPDRQRGHTDGVPDAVVQRLGDVLAVVRQWNEAAGA